MLGVGTTLRQMVYSHHLDVRSGGLNRQVKDPCGVLTARKYWMKANK